MFDEESFCNNKFEFTCQKSNYHFCTVYNINNFSLNVATYGNDHLCLTNFVNTIGGYFLLL